MTDDELRTIEARASKATEGPWEWGIANPEIEPSTFYASFLSGTARRDDISLVWAPEHPGTVIGSDVQRPEFSIVPAITGNGPDSEANATFIAAAREDVPRLCAEVRRLRAALESVQEHSDVDELVWTFIEELLHPVRGGARPTEDGE